MKFIDVDQQAIAEGKPDPVNIRIKVPGKDEFVHIRVHDIWLHGLARVRYCPIKPLPCGARVWIETEGMVMYKSSELLDWQRIP